MAKVTVKWVVLTEGTRSHPTDFVVKLQIYKRKENTACVQAHVSQMSATLQDGVSLSCISGLALPEGRQALTAGQAM